MRIAAACVVLLLAVPAPLAEPPAIRPGLWKFAYTGSTSPLGPEDPATSVSLTACTQNMKGFLRKQAGALPKLCTFSTPVESGGTFTMMAKCELHEAQEQLNAKLVGTITSETRVRGIVEYGGTIGSKAVRWTDTVKGRWLGPCPK